MDTGSSVETLRSSHRILLSAGGHLKHHWSNLELDVSRLLHFREDNLNCLLALQSLTPLIRLWL